MASERRDTLRVPDNRLITEFVLNRPDAASIVNLSYEGIYTVKSTRSRGVRGPRKIQMEIPVPEASKSIWALGEIVFERVGMSCVGSGIRFLAMANSHKNLLRDLIEARRHQLLAEMIQVAQAQKDLTLISSDLDPYPAAPRENTQVMYRLGK
ncbi:MAG: hypothetical protein GY762_18220 [Proteobacteria bacterium]|nr:hypothetical protein [Pseudomonadota bacterium]